MGTIDSLLAEHVSFRCTSVDRIGIRGYIPGLQYEGGVVKFLLKRGFPIPSPAALNKAHERLVADLDALVSSAAVPLVRFKGGDCKEDIARPFQDEAAAAGHYGLVLVGKAQERTSSWRGFVDPSRTSHHPGHPHISWARQSSVPDHWYFYFADQHWDPAFLKMCTYAPYGLWGCLLTELRLDPWAPSVTVPYRDCPRPASGSRDIGSSPAGNTRGDRGLLRALSAA